MLGLLIGRFQPAHMGHICLIKDAIGKCSKLLLLLGSSSDGRTRKNPFLWQERSEMIRMSLTPEENMRVLMYPLSDYDTDESWCKAVRTIVSDYEKLCIGGVRIFGCNKDSSSAYLQWFPQYEYCVLGETYLDGLSSTPLREAYLDYGVISDQLCEGAKEFLSRVSHQQSELERQSNV